MEQALFHGDFVNTRRILYTPSDFAKISLLHLQEIGELQAQKTHASKREHLSSFLFFIVVSGSGTLKYRGQTYTLEKGNVVFIDCKYPYSHQTSENLWKLRWIHFYGSTLTNIYDKYIERGGQPVFYPTNLTGFENIWQKIYATASSDDYIRDMRINENLTSLLTLFMEESWQPDQARVSVKRQNLMNVKDYLDEHSFEKITLDELEEKFFINKFYLTRIFKEQFGVSINQYLLQKKITYAKQQLRFSNKTVEVIGTECGMSDVHYFSRMFKKVEGLSPSEYRKLW